MGKPKYYEGQILKCRQTGDLFVLTNTGHNLPVFTIKPITDLTKKVTPNYHITNYWYVGKTKVKDKFTIPNKREVANTAKAVKVLYSKKAT